MIGTVWGITEADDGVMWFATDKGVIKFDGASWTGYSIEASGVTETRVNAIAVDRKGVVWLAFNNSGVVSFDGTTWTNYTKENSGIGSNTINVIAVDSKNVIWFGSQELWLKNALFSFDGTAWQSHTIEFVTDIEVDTSGTVLVASDSSVRLNSFSVGMAVPRYSLKKYDGESWSDLYFEDLPYPITGFWQIEIDADGTLWFVTVDNIWASRSLHSFDGVTLRTYLTDGPRSYWINDVCTDTNNITWFAARYCITKYDGKTWENISFYEDPSLFYEGYDAYVLCDDVYAIVQDHDNILWTASMTGIRTFDGSSWRHVDVPIVSGSNIKKSFIDVNDIAVDLNNVKWFANHNSISSYDGAVWKTYKINEVRAYTVAVDMDNVKWFGVLWPVSGVMSFDGETWTTYSEENSGLKGTNIYAVTVDRKNVKWVVTDEGVWSYDGSAWTSHTDSIRNFLSSWDSGDAAGNSKVHLYDCSVDADNTKWFCGSNKIVSFDGISWKLYKKDHSYQKIAVSGDGVLWAVGSSIEWINLSDIEKYAEPSIVYNENALPAVVSINGNYPNPFNPVTTIEFSLPETGFTTLTIYSITGQKVRELAGEQFARGAHTVVWDGRDDLGGSVSSGVYLCRLRMGDQVTAKRMLLLR